MSRDPEKLEVFHLAHGLVIQVYELTASLPDPERFGLQVQLRRAAVSISTNLVEGSYRQSTADYARFVDIAVGSAAEVRYLLKLAGDLKLLSGSPLEQCRRCSDHVVRALQNLRTAVGQFPRK